LPEPKVAFTVFPVFLSKAGIISSIAARIPPGAMSVTSAALAVPQIAAVAANVMAADMIRMVFPFLRRR
jgi:hypothetical protein